MKKLIFLILCFGFINEVFPQAADINYIVLNMNEKNDKATVAFYVAIADSDNFASVNFRAALLQSGRTFQDFLISPLRDSLTIAAIVEVVQTVQFDANLTKLQKRNAIDSFYTSKKASFLSNLYREFDFWGFERSGL